MAAQILYWLKAKLCYGSFYDSAYVACLSVGPCNSYGLAERHFGCTDKRFIFWVIADCDSRIRYITINVDADIYLGQVGWVGGGVVVWVWGVVGGCLIEA